MPTAKTSTATRIEGVVLVAIVILVGTAAGAASFTHVKDWTLHNSPAGTGAWFGWANAVISELVPIAALLTIRRRKRTRSPIGYPLFLLIAAASLSLAAQLAVAKPGPSGWLLSAVPALAFMALVKLVLAPTKNVQDDREPVPASASTDVDQPDTTRPTSTDTYDTPAATPAVTDSTPADPEPAITPAVEPIAIPRPQVPAHLLPTARFAVVQHEQTTGQTITIDELAARLNITPAVAGQLLTTITSPATVNGTPLGGAR